MSVTLTTNANESSTYIVTVSFLDEDGAAETPSSVTWTLTDAAGNVINSRQDVSIAAASTINIVLSGADLQMTAGQSNDRVLTVEAVYNSVLASNLPLKEQINFKINDLVAV